MRENTGKVVLVGAGPGDTGLLTLKGEKYIKQADCLVYDRLSSPEFLSMAKAGCELIYVGKENHKHVMKQDAINELLYEKSKYHELVVRLKGGDPYVFGRGGEEALYLVDRNVEVEVVPGVSSSVAALAAAGIPITHRGIAKGFQVITAHSRKDEEADIDYSLLTDETITCVFLMGLAHVKSIAAGLMKAGRRSDTPAAVISNGTLAAQRKCIGTLADIGEKIEEAKLTSPAIIVVGDVVSLNDRLDFFEKRPLFRRKITVPYIKTNGLIAKLQQLGADVTPVKTGIINPIIIPKFADKVRSADWIVFTSKNGVRSFFYNLELAGADIRLIASVRFAVVGKATEKELAKHHIKADIIPAEQTGKGLADAMKLCMPYVYGESDEDIFDLGKKSTLYLSNGNISDKMCKVCIFSAKEASPDLEAGLKEICELEKIDAYVNEQAYESIPESIGNMVSEAVFTSASNVERFFHMLPENAYVETAYSIGEKTTAALEQHNVREILQADDSSYEALVDTICYKA
ncbi:uroporphyrinogen-III C-methyltransferase [[Eubacterium] rectale]|uniref:uroporphyrinogen-III C-methyltransferase n=1 Tax=Agathobacter rectalis TaxID=39491 RepID=UPI0027D252B1|nr:uroporphyrinogen-III C-methyltransferase [Agathobacter rectalis]MBT9695304.1 uroporphyrinogen-III C-methyltransferase [Agathobacter rectalis]